MDQIELLKSAVKAQGEFNEALISVVKDMATQIAGLQSAVAAMQSVYPGENDRDASQVEINKNVAAWLEEAEAKINLLSSKLGVQ